MQKKRTKFHLSYLDHAIQGLTPFNEICFSCFTYTVTIRFNEFKRNKLHVSSAVIVTQKMFEYCGGLGAVRLFVNRSAMFVEAVFKSTFGFSYVLFVTVVTFYHVESTRYNVTTVPLVRFFCISFLCLGHLYYLYLFTTTFQVVTFSHNYQFLNF